MTITFKKGDIFESGADVLVNPVNLVGVSGKGLALEFKKRFPDNFESYKWACDNKLLKPGMIWLWRNVAEPPTKPSFIINFPTKRHWKDKSLMEDIEAGLLRVAASFKVIPVKTIAMPALGCGLGGLAWKDVKKSIEKHLSMNYDWQITVFEPEKNMFR